MVGSVWKQELARVDANSCSLAKTCQALKNDKTLAYYNYLHGEGKFRILENIYSYREELLTLANSY